MKKTNIALEESYLLEIFDIAKYAASIEDTRTYRKASDKLSSIMHSYVGRQLESSQTKQRGLDFSEIYIELITQIQGMVCKQEDNFFAHDSWLISVWYNPIHYVPLSEDTLRHIWQFVLKVIDADKEDWFMSYWTYADQYYRFSIEGNVELRNAPLFQRQKMLLKQMHLGIGAYIFYRKKYSLLKKILNFTQTVPPSYGLLDNTFDQIIYDIGQIYELCEQPLELTKKYMMSGLINDVNSDSYVAGKFNAYFALLMVRLAGLDFNVSFCDPLQPPAIDANSNLSSLETQIKYVDVLKYFLKDKDFVDTLKDLGFSEEQKVVAAGAVDGYRESLQKSIEYKVNHSETDTEKIGYIKNKLITEIHSQKLYLPTKEDSKLTGDTTRDEYYSGQDWQLSVEDIAKDRTRLSVNLEEALISYMLEKECQFYNTFFLLNKPVVTYTIRFKDLMLAWRKLGVDENFVILSMGVPLGTFEGQYGKDEYFEFAKAEGSFNGAKIKSLQSSMLSFVIIPKEYLPYVEHPKIEDGILAKGVSCIDEESALYSNVDHIDADKNRVLVVRRKVHIVHKTDFTKYVMLKIKYRNDSSPFDLNNIENLSQFIVLNK